MSAFVRPSIPGDAQALYRRLRPADAAEVALWGLNPLETLLEGQYMSVVCYTIEYEGEPAAMFGVTPVGGVWLLGSPDIESFKFRFLRQSRLWIEELCKRAKELGHTTVGNWVDMANTVHVRWLRAFGFQSREPMAVTGKDGRTTTIAYFWRNT